MKITGLSRKQFEAAVTQHYSILVKAAHAAGAPEPEDAVQQAVLELLETQDYRDFVPDPERADILTWLTKVVLLRVKRQFRPRPELTEDELPMARQETHEDIERRLDIERAMAALPPAQAKVVRLHYFEGLSAAEIGRQLSLAPKTVWNLLSEARAALRTRS